MSAIVPISLTNVAPAFNFQLDPQSINGGLASYLDTSGGVPLGYPKLTASLTRPSKGSKYTRVRIRLALPVLNAAVAGQAQTLAYENFADITYTFSESSSLEDRQIVRTALEQILADVTILAMVDDLQQLY